MEKGALASKYTDRTNPLEWQANLMSKVQGFNAAPPAAQMFGGIAVVLAAVNIFGGFIVTHRMLSMFKKKPVKK